MKTVTVSIGNSDNKLTQEQWATFVSEVRWYIQENSEEIFFFGGPPNYESYQNVTFVFSIQEDKIDILKHQLKEIRKDYRQDSLAWVEGETEFI